MNLDEIIDEHSEPIIVDEGDPCPDKCGGTMHYPPVKDCSCHISPPCHNCVNNFLTCDKCGFEVE